MNSLFHKPNYFVNYFMKIKFMAIIKDKNLIDIIEQIEKDGAEEQSTI